MKKKKVILSILLSLGLIPALMIVIMIGMVMYTERHQTEKRATVQVMQRLSFALNEHYAEHGHYPDSVYSVFTIDSAQPVIEKYEKTGFIDGFGKPLNYSATSNSFDLISSGIDRTMYTDDDIRIDIID